MPPLPGYKELQTAGRIISSYKERPSLKVSIAVLATAVAACIVLTYVLHRQSRTIDASVDVSEKPTIKPLLERQDSATCQNQWESDHKNHLKSLKQEIFEHTEKPIFPWVSPPQALPGPYDPIYYPLPPPSSRCETSGSLMASTEGRHSASYTQLVPKSSTSLGETVLYGTVTTSTNGWRRSHWNAFGG